ncbi:2-hydroxychromene-2-carboxylate isomerase [Panacagrimonas perspica]|uniref:2-hydroxychromene-2-carboxylate isomerase n=2 Tax=Panacagrimonas perspica TaxID=381431 RepID=A0A4R7P3M8_9GAMM|nr:2-hydroxychromene-2-carboxylate isomerase [Panacagrimonas perspica]
MGAGHNGDPLPIDPASMIEFYFDISSPWTYLAFHNVQPIARELDVRIAWKPILVGGIFNSVNPGVYEFRKHGAPSKQRYHEKDLADWARHTGLAIRFPPTIFPINSVKAMRACILLDKQGKLPEFARAAFEAYWARDEDIASDDVLAAICRSVGVDAGAVIAGIGESAVKDQLRRNTDELIERGGFGSPTMFVNGTDMYFGNDRLHLVREALLRARG